MVDSPELVPGDIVNLSDLRAPFFPADMLLLSGDAVANESMLTGESVPVSKNPVKDEDIARWRDVKDVQGDLAKGFLYTGTRIIRIRGALGLDGGVGRPSLGLVVRTGSICVSPPSDHADMAGEGSTQRKVPLSDQCCFQSRSGSSFIETRSVSSWCSRGWLVWASARVPFSLSSSG